MKEIIQEYLVKLGWQIDETGFNKATAKLGEVGKKVEALTNKLVNNPEMKEAGKKVTDFIDNLAGPEAQKVTGAISTTKAAAIAAFAGIAAAAVALGATLAAAFAGFLNNIAQADLRTQVFARRLLTTVDNARSLQAVMDAMGLKSIEELNDVALNPELRKQFLELRKIAGSLSLTGGQEQGLKNIRAIGFELSKIGLMINFIFQRLAGDFGSIFSDELKASADAIKSLGQALLKAIDLGRRFVALLDRIGLLGEIFEKPLNRLTALLNLVNILLDQLGKAADIVSGGGRSGGGADAYKQSETAIQSLARNTRGIYDLLKNVWNTVSMVFRRIASKLGDLPVIGGFFKDSTGGGGGGGMPTPANLGHELGKQAGTAIKQMLGGGKLTAAPGVRLNQTLLAYANNLQKMLNDKFTITSGVASRSGRSDHPIGKAIDIGIAGKTDAQVTDLVAAVLKSRGTRIANLEFTPDRYNRVMNNLRGMGIDTSKTRRQITKDYTGEHLHVGVDPKQITININGAGDPKAVAVEVERRLTAMNARATRNVQGVIA